MSLVDMRGGLDEGREYPLEQPPLDAPGYREKYWACGYDGAAGIGFSIWLETTAADYSVWQEVVHVVLPDGRIFLSSTETPRMTPSGVGGGFAAGTCEAPFHKWSYRVRSAMNAATAADLARRPEERPPPAPGPPTEVALDLALISTAPAWNLSRAGSASAAEAAFATQYRQLFRATGDVRVGDDFHAGVEATGFRAHSSGPYHGTTFGGHSMISVQFPSGRGAGFLQHVRPDGSPIVSQGFVLEGDTVIPAQVAEAPRTLPGLSPGGERFTVRLRTDARDYLVDVEVLVNVTSVRPNYFASTARTQADREILSARGDGLANAISYGRFELDGETGFGVIERSTLTSRLGGA